MQHLSSDFIHHLSEYGYMIIFLLVLLQEVGVPSPLPNELVLLFSGYMVYLGRLHILYIFLSALTGDILGSTILFTVFFFFGKQIIENKPRWLPIPEAKLAKLSDNLQKMGIAGVLLGRLSPFIRGYVSVLCGLMNYEPRRYALIISITAPVWASFYVITGFLLGPYWKSVSHYVSDIPMYIGFVPLTILVCYIAFQFIKNSIVNRQVQA